MYCYSLIMRERPLCENASPIDNIPKIGAISNNPDLKQINVGMNLGVFLPRNLPIGTILYCDFTISLLTHS